MYENLVIKDRIARKKHTCDLCGKIIDKGEKYEYQKFIYDGAFYEWRSHLACSRVSSAIWDYADPDEGMSSDEFDSACADVCGEFICPDCPKWNKEFEDCDDDLSYCIDRMDEFFKTHELYRWKRNGCVTYWRCREKQAERRSAENE